MLTSFARSGGSGLVAWAGGSAGGELGDQSDGAERSRRLGGIAGVGKEAADADVNDAVAAGSVGYLAHVGGFLAGALTMVPYIWRKGAWHASCQLR